MPTKTTPTDIRYEYMHIDMTNIFPNLFAKIIAFSLLSSIIFYMLLHIVRLFFVEKYMNRFLLVSSKKKKSSTDDDHVRGCCK
jgi:hypothetical protein